MLVSEIKGDWANSLIAKTYLWNRHIENLRPLDVEVFLRSHWGTPEYNEATRQVEEVIDKGWHAVIDRKIQETPAIISFNPNTPVRITVGELCSWLEQTTVVRRRAVLFALETGLSVRKVVELTWKKLRDMQDVSDYAMSLCKANTRHLKLDYVFWEQLPNLAVAPLFGFGETVFEVSQGMGLDALRSLYQNAIPIHEGADYRDFAEKIDL